MKRLITLRHALEDPNWLGQMLGAPSFKVMRTLLIAAMGEPLTPEEMPIFTELTQRTETPSEPVDELWVVAARRSGVVVARPAQLPPWPPIWRPASITALS